MPYQLSVSSSVHWGTTILRFGLVVLCAIAVLRLFWLQGWKGPVWRVQAESNRRQRITVRAPRGLIFDRNGQVIARNRFLWVEPYVDDKKTLQERLINEAEAVALQATDPAKVKKMYVREYPYGPVLSHVLGYTTRSTVSSDVVQGQVGLESFLNDTLTGRDGETWYERSAAGAAHRLLAEREPQAGKDVTLTLDAELSRVAYEALGDQTGSVVVTTPEGEVLVAVSTPSYVPLPPAERDPTQTTADSGASTQVAWSGNPAANIVAALTDERSPLLFRAVAGTYPPGSVFKMVTALAGLERDAITASTTVNDQGVLTVGDFSYQNWYWRQYGRVEGEVNVVRALARSNDIFFYRLAEWTGPEALAEFADWFGYGHPTGLEGVREQAGLVPTPTWKQQTLGERWFLGNTYHIGIGQGDLLVTPAQVTVMMNTVATRGRQCNLHFFLSGSQRCQEISLQEETWESVILGLRQACSPGGTAYPLFDTGYDVICKTGTAEFGAANEQGYRPTHGWLTVAASRQPRQEPENATFEPDIIVTVMVESDETQLYKEGSRDAAPIARKILDTWQGITPPADDTFSSLRVPSD